MYSLRANSTELRAMDEEDEDAADSDSPLQQHQTQHRSRSRSTNPSIQQDSLFAALLNSSHLNLDSLRDLLKCVSCHRTLFPPIVQWLVGHMACRGCYESKAQCARCGQKVLEVPAKLAEMITEQFEVPCSYVEKGCPESIPFKVRLRNIDDNDKPGKNGYMANG